MTIEERIELLERTNRRYRLMFALFGVVAVCAVGIGAAQDTKVPGMIKAKGFVVVDDEGNHLAFLGNDSDKGMLALLNERGRIFLSLSNDKEGTGSVTTWSEKGKRAVRLGSALNGAGRITIFNKEEVPVVDLAVNKVGSGGISTYNKKGMRVLMFGAADGDGMIALLNNEGNPSLVLSSLDNGGYMTVYNKTGEPVGSLEVDESGNGKISAWDRKGMGKTLKLGPK